MVLTYYPEVNNKLCEFYWMWSVRENIRQSKSSEFYFICLLFWNPVCKATWVSACRLWVSFPGPVETDLPEWQFRKQVINNFFCRQELVLRLCLLWHFVSQRFEVWIALRLILRSEHVDSYTTSRPRGEVHLKKAPTSQKMYCLSFKNISLVNDIKGNNDNFFLRTKWNPWRHSVVSL